MKVLLKTSILLAFIVALFSCGKQSTDENPGNGNTNGADNTPRVKTKTTATETTTYTYDINGRILNSISTNGNKEVYTYAINQILINKNNINPGGFIPFLVTNTLNTNGLVEKVTDSQLPGYSLQYQYNTDKTISKFDEFSGPNIQLNSYFYTNGNLDSIRGTDENNNWTITSTYTYYLDNPNVLSIINGVNYGKPFWGKGSSNMLKSQHWRYPSPLVRHWDYEYNYDLNGRVIKKTSTENNGNVSIETYTY